MNAQRRVRVVSSLAIVALAMGLGLFATRFLGDESGSPANLAARDAGARTAAAAEGAGAASLAPGDSRRGEAAAPSRAAEPVEPLAAPSRDALAELEANGRVLFFGVVTGFDDAPCPGAWIFHDGERVGSSDAEGRYRVEVAQNSWNPMSASRWSNFLSAVKEGVGSVAVDCNGRSRRIDLKLQCRTVFAGHCIQRRSREPVAGARVELLCVLNSFNETVPLFSLATTCDDKGAFRFVGVAPQRVELRALAEGFASDGWFPFDVANGRDRTNVEFELERIAHARGWFVPWPPPVVSRAAAADARVVAIPGAGRESGPAVEPIVAKVAPDGAFDVAFATCSGIDFVLEAGGGALWRERLGHDFDGEDVDFGKITLGDPIALTGRVALPRDVLELGFEFLVVVRLETGARHFRFPVDLDGTFRAEPIPSGRILGGVVLGSQLVIPGSLKYFAGESAAVFGDDQELEPGSRVDLGVLAPSGRLVAGRVTLASGTGTAGAAGAILQLPLQIDGSLGSINGLDDEGLDARGRFVFKVDFGERPSDDPWELALTRPIFIAARRRDEVGSSAPFRLPARGEAIRCDVEMRKGLRLCGRVVDAGGAPLAGGNLSLVPQVGETAIAFWPDHLSATTDAAGEFELTGLEDADYRARLLLDGKWLELGRVRPGGPAVTLTARPGG